MIDIIQTEDAFDALRSEWETLEAHPHVSIFQTFAWCRAGWRNCLSNEEKNSLWILKWHQDGKKGVVIFPFYIDGNGVLRFIMNGDSDVGDCLYALGENHYYAYKEAVEEIKKNKRIRIVSLGRLHGDGEAMNYFSVLLPRINIYKENGFSWVEHSCSDDIAGALPHFKTKDRSLFKHIVAESAPYKFEVISKHQGIPYPQQEVTELSEYMISAKMRERGFFRPELMAHIEQMYDGGLCEIARLTRDGVCQALSYRLLKSDRSLCWIVLYRENKMTTIMDVRYILERAKSDKGIVDFGIGAYDYKFGTFRPCLGGVFILTSYLDDVAYAQQAKRNVLGALKAYVKLLIGRKV